MSTSKLEQIRSLGPPEASRRLDPTATKIVGAAVGAVRLTAGEIGQRDAIIATQAKTIAGLEELVADLRARLGPLGKDGNNSGNISPGSGSGPRRTDVTLRKGSGTVPTSRDTPAPPCAVCEARKQAAAARQRKARGTR